jgi:hypothetical protein
LNSFRYRQYQSICCCGRFHRVCHLLVCYAFRQVLSILSET